MTLADLRKEYSLAGLAEADLAREPFRQFEKWFQEAEAAKLPEPNAMLLATADADGRPSARTVLLKGLDGRGFVFYTNYESRKGRELAVNPRATLVFPWFPIERQVIIEGAVVKVAREESEAYYATRPRASQLAAWVSQQSALVPARSVLEEGYKAVERPFHVKHLHATILHLMGVDPNRLAFLHAGLDQRLVGTEGAQPIRELLA